MGIVEDSGIIDHVEEERTPRLQTSAGVLNTGDSITGPNDLSAVESHGLIRTSTGRNSSTRAVRPRGRSWATMRKSMSESLRGVPRPTEPNTATDTSRAP